MKEHALGKMILLLAIVLGWLAFGIMTLARLGKRKCRKPGSGHGIQAVCSFCAGDGIHWKEDRVGYRNSAVFL